MQTGKTHGDEAKFIATDGSIWFKYFDPDTEVLTTGAILANRHGPFPREIKERACAMLRADGFGEDVIADASTRTPHDMRHSGATIIGG